MKVEIAIENGRPVAHVYFDEHAAGYYRYARSEENGRWYGHGLFNATHLLAIEEAYERHVLKEVMKP